MARTKRKRVITLTIVSCLLVCGFFAIWRACGFPFCFCHKAFDAVVQDYREGQFNTTVNACGSFAMPWHCRFLSSHPRVYKTRTPWGDALVFVTKKGKCSDMDGYVFFTNLADPSAPPMPSSYRFLVPGESDADASPLGIAVQELKGEPPYRIVVQELDIGKSVAPGWFPVSYQDPTL